jgi:hypothetical protein
MGHVETVVAYIIYNIELITEMFIEKDTIDIIRVRRE